jgi:thiol-disulfide isomerase/thioredoxin
MGKADRNRRESAREKIAAQQAAERRAQKRRQILMAGGSVVAVLAIVVVLIVVKSLNKTSAGSNVGTASASTVSKLTSVPAATLASVNKGSANPKTLIPITGTALTANGKPEVLYMGAEYCPFCATERWAMTVALSRFGTFSGLSFIHSSGTDTPASIPTLTFYKSTYTSKYLTFTPVEMQKVDKSTLQTPSKTQSAILTKYDGPPQLPSQDAGSIPFIDFGNKYMVSGASYDYSVLQGKSYSQIAAAIQDPSTAIAQGADGTANYLTAGICKLTNNQPATVCAAPLITSLQSRL